MKPQLVLSGRAVGLDHPPLVIAEIGINHEGSFDKAVQLVDGAYDAGCECVKFQCHVIDDEMTSSAQDVVPGNAAESIWAIMSRCALDEEAERELKRYVESKGMIYLSTPFSRAAADRLLDMDVDALKIGSGECNNYPLIRHIARAHKPVILSTGMNDLASIAPAVQILREARIPFALLHCTSMYPTPYEQVRLGAMQELAQAFPDAVVGLSDHSLGIYTCLGAVALGASIIEKHFTIDKSWPGPDVSISIDTGELRELIRGATAIHAARGGHKEILAEEEATIRFAYASVVAIRDIREGETLTAANVWVKRPGTGEILATRFDEVLGRTAARAIPVNTQLRWEDLHARA